MARSLQVQESEGQGDPVVAAVLLLVQELVVVLVPDLEQAADQI